MLQTTGSELGLVLPDPTSDLGLVNLTSGDQLGGGPVVDSNGVVRVLTS